MPVQNMVLYPNQDYGQYQQRPSSASSSSSSAGSMSSLQHNAALLLSSLAAGMSPGNGAAAAGTAVPGSNAAILSLGDSQPAHATENVYPMISLRPLIDSIFEVSSHNLPKAV